MRKVFFGGNWKMNGDTASLSTLIEAIKTNTPDHADIVVFPNFVYLPMIRKSLVNHPIQLGAQNCCDHEQGAYTGEVSANMLQDIGCQYVLLGHSECRHLYGETDHMIARKFALAKTHRLIPVLCIGETEIQRDTGQTNAILEEQLDAVINDVGIQALHNSVIAYEPVWAIGTGQVATPEIAQATHAHIRAHLAKHDNTIAEDIRIIYGGSMKPNNAKDLLAQADIDGGLIGGASLNAEDFLKIVMA